MSVSFACLKDPRISQKKRGQGNLGPTSPGLLNPSNLGIPLEKCPNLGSRHASLGSSFAIEMSRSPDFDWDTGSQICPKNSLGSRALQRHTPTCLGHAGFEQASNGGGATLGQFPATHRSLPVPPSTIHSTPNDRTPFIPTCKNHPSQPATAIHFSHSFIIAPPTRTHTRTQIYCNVMK